MKTIRWLAAVAAVIGAGWSSSGSADSPDSFYAGKQVRLVVGAARGATMTSLLACSLVIWGATSQETHL
jgi:hypothetical protein